MPLRADEEISSSFPQREIFPSLSREQGALLALVEDVAHQGEAEVGVAEGAGGGSDVQKGPIRIKPQTPRWQVLLTRLRRRT